MADGGKSCRHGDNNIRHAPAKPPFKFTMASEHAKELTKLKVADLRAQLEERGLDPSGPKDVLVLRLADALAAQKQKPRRQTEAERLAMWSFIAEVKGTAADSDDDSESEEDADDMVPTFRVRTPFRTSTIMSGVVRHFAL